MATLRVHCAPLELKKFIQTVRAINILPLCGQAFLIDLQKHDTSRLLKNIWRLESRTLWRISKTGASHKMFFSRWLSLLG